MKSTIGRALQVIGMALVLVGLLVGISVGNVRAELIYMGVGVLAFYLGRVVETGRF